MILDGVSTKKLKKFYLENGLDSSSKEFRTLRSKMGAMVNRCYNENNPSYKNYGERGIRVCSEWYPITPESTVKFIKWALSNGYKEGLSLDRIDVNRNYEPSNCRWISMFEQQSNKRNNHYLELNGEVKHIAEWERELGISGTCINERIRRGWQEEDLLNPINIRTAEQQSILENVGWNKSRNRWKATSKTKDNTKRQQEFIGWYYTRERAEYAKIIYESTGEKIHNKDITDEMLKILPIMIEEYQKTHINHYKH